MHSLILEYPSSKRQHRDHLNLLLKSTHDTIRIASAYVTDRGLAKEANGREMRLLLSLSPMDIISGATSIDTIEWMLDYGIKCRVLPDRPRLHAKVYIFGTDRAVVTSANLTYNAFNSNIEVGVEVKEEQVSQLTEWFDNLWDEASPLYVADLKELRERTISLRQQYSKLQQKSKPIRTRFSPKQSDNIPMDPLQYLFVTASQFFICNTDRKQGEQTVTGGFVLEQAMHSRCFATAWETFKYDKHMNLVKPGDAIFMFAKGVGIIGIGVALATCETLQPDDPDRVCNLDYENNTTEWRIPVKWLAWTDEAGACPYSESPNFTFWNITGQQYAPLRERIKSHFMNDT